MSTLSKPSLVLVLALAALSTLVAFAAVVAQASKDPGLGVAGDSSPGGLPAIEQRTVRLVTGDEITITRGEGGAVLYSVNPAVEARNQRFIIFSSPRGGVYAIPRGVSLDKVDINLFNLEVLEEIQRATRGEFTPLIIELSVKPPVLARGGELGVTLEAYSRVRDLVARLGGEVVREFQILPLMSVKVTPETSPDLLRELTSTSLVKKVWLDYLVNVTLDRSVPLIGADKAHQLGVNGSGVVIAVLDTGVNKHPDLATRITYEESFIDYNFDGVPDETVFDYYGHGTHVAGIAAGDGSLARAFGWNLTGVAPAAEVWNLKVLSREGFGFISWIIAGIERAVLGPDGNITTPDNADIINMSLGAPVPSDGTDPLSQAVDQAFLNGVLPVVAAGNSGPGYLTVGIPASSKLAVTVGAMDPDTLDIAVFSSWGPTLDLRIKPEVVAPGVNIMSAVATGSLLEWLATVLPLDTLDVDGDGFPDYMRLSGTSMATPHVAGMAALIIQSYRDKGVEPSPETVASAIISTADELGNDALVEGSGLINVTRALGTPILPFPYVDHQGVVVGGDLTVNITVSATGLGSSPGEKYQVNVTVVLVNLVDGADYSGLVSVNATSLLVDSGGSAGVSVTIPVDNITTGYYVARVYFKFNKTATSLDVVKSLISFAKLRSVDIEVIDPFGSPAPGALVLTGKTEYLTPIDWLLSATVSVTGPDGVASVLLPDGNISVVVSHAAASDFIGITRAEVTGPTRLLVNGSNSRRVTLTYQEPMFVFSKEFRATLEAWFQPVPLADGREGAIFNNLMLVSWLAPVDNSFYILDEVGVNSVVVYEYYPARFLLGNITVLATPDWFEVLVNTTGLPGDITVSHDEYNYSLVNIEYKMPPEAGASASFSVADYIPVGPPDLEFSRLMKLPARVREWYTPNVPVHKILEKSTDLPGRETPDWRSTSFFVTSTSPTNLVIGQYPLSPEILVGVESDAAGQFTNITVYSDMFAGGGGDSVNWVNTEGFIKVYKDGALVVEGPLTGADFFSIDGTGDFVVEVEGFLNGKQVFSGSRAWWSGTGDNIDHWLVYSIDLTNLTTATLRFATRYFIEAGFDFGYLLISRDGRTWDLLKSYTGTQPSWVVEEFNISAYAGGTVYIAFRFVTDPFIHLEGWYVDDVEVPEAGFKDDVEGPVRATTVTGWSVVEQKGFYFRLASSFTVNPNTTISFRTPVVLVEGTDLFNTVVGGPVRGSVAGIGATINATTLQPDSASVFFSLDRGATWEAASFDLSTGAFNFTPGSSGVLALRVNSSVGAGALSIDYQAYNSLGFEILAPFTLADFPAPFATPEGVNVILVPGSSDARGPVDPAHTIDVAAGMSLAWSLGAVAGSGTAPQVLLDFQVANYNSTHVTRIYRPGNIIAFGGPFVNLVTWYYHYAVTDPNTGEPVLPVYIGFDQQGAFIYSKRTGARYRMVNDYWQGKNVTDYAMIVLYNDVDRTVMIIAGLSGYSTRNAAEWLASMPRDLWGQAVILEFFDQEGDGIPEQVSVVEVVP